MNANQTGSTLIAHCGGSLRTRDELQWLDTPEPTRTWRPVPHYELACSLIDSLVSAGVIVRREQYATSHDDHRLFGVLDLVVPNLVQADYSMAVGIRTANDRTMALQIIAAARVFVCDNMAFSGQGGTICLKRKHTAKLSLPRILPPAVDRYLFNASAFVKSIEHMKDHALSDDRAKSIILDAFTGRLALPMQLLRPTTDLYFADEVQRERFPDRTLWSLNNAFTESAKVLKPEPFGRATVGIGRYFAWVASQASGSSVIMPALPAPSTPSAESDPWEVLGPEGDPID